MSDPALVAAYEAAVAAHDEAAREAAGRHLAARDAESRREAARLVLDDAAAALAADNSSMS